MGVFDLWEVGVLPSEDLKQHVQDIIQLLGEEAEKKINAEELEAELEKFLDYGVPMDQAKKTLLKKFGGLESIARSSERCVLSGLEANQRQVKVLAQVIAINPKEVTIRGEPRQIFYGILGDESGTMPFTAWDDPQVNKGDVIEIVNAYTKEWQGAVQLNMSERSHIEKKDKSALPKEAFQPKKSQIQELRSGIGSVEINAVILEVDTREVVVDDKKKQVFSGVIGDKTGKIQFTAWNDFSLKKDETYNISCAFVKSWKGLPQLSFDDQATVKKEKDQTISPKDVPIPMIALSDIVEVSGRFDVRISGTVIDILAGSGFILRCPECNRMLFDGTCKIHGDQEGVPDLRIKCIVDDGNGSVNAIIDRVLSEKILDKTLKDFKSLDPVSLQHIIVNTLFARPITLRGNAITDSFGTTFLVQDATLINEDVNQIASDLEQEMEGLE